MTAKQRLVAALDRQPTDRLPVTTHHLMQSYMARHFPGQTDDDFFAAFGLDPICWVQAHRPDPNSTAYFESGHVPGFLEARRITSGQWRFEHETVATEPYCTERHNIVTPRGTLTMVLQSNADTTWVAERLVKRKSDIELIAAFAPQPR